MPLTSTSSDFERLLAEHGAEVRRFLGRASPSAADADELFQDACVRAYRGFEATQPLNPRAWLFRIAANAATDAQRRAGRERPLDVLAAAAALHQVEDIALAREELARVRQLMDELPPRQRRALLLRRVDGFTYEHVAARMGGNPQTARANVYQALKRLKRQLKEDS